LTQADYSNSVSQSQ